MGCRMYVLVTFVVAFLRADWSCDADSNTIGLIAGVASTDWGCAVELMVRLCQAHQTLLLGAIECRGLVMAVLHQAAVSIGSNQTFTATTSQTL